jgi:hypothetical protein
VVRGTVTAMRRADTCTALCSVADRHLATLEKCLKIDNGEQTCKCNTFAFANTFKVLRSEFLTEVKISMFLFWVAKMCGLLRGYRRFGRKTVLSLSLSSSVLQGILIFVHFNALTITLSIYKELNICVQMLHHRTCLQRVPFNTAKMKRRCLSTTGNLSISPLKE